MTGKYAANREIPSKFARFRAYIKITSTITHARARESARLYRCAYIHMGAPMHQARLRARLPVPRKLVIPPEYLYEGTFVPHYPFSFDGVPSHIVRRAPYPGHALIPDRPGLSSSALDVRHTKCVTWRRTI